MKHSEEQRWADICALNDLTPHRGVGALLGEEQIAVFYLPEEQAVYAIHNYDPIGKANVLARGIVGDVKGELVVASPLYKQHFSLLTGQCLENQDIRVPTFEVKIENGRVLIRRS